MESHGATKSCTLFGSQRTTPSGRPASFASLASIIGGPGSISEGFITKVLPLVTATGNIQRGIMAGKLKGVMPAHTPSGWRIM